MKPELNLRIHQKTSTKISILGFCSSFLFFNPGWLSADSVDQLNQAATWSFSDWHPVAMAFWWAITSTIFGPTFLLAQQLIFYWAAWAVASAALVAKFGTKFRFFPLVGFWPGFLTTFGHYWKDNQFAASLLLAVSAVFFFVATKTSPGRKTCVALGILLTYAFLVKPTGIFAVLICWLWLCSQLGTKQDSQTRRRKWLTFIALPLTLGLSYLTLQVALNPAKGYLHQVVMIHDVQAVSVSKDLDLRPAYLREKVSLEDFKTSYFPENANRLLWQMPGGSIISSSADEIKALEKSWLSAIILDPIEYVQHRTRVFFAELRIGEIGASFVANGFSDSNNFGYVQKASGMAIFYVATPILLPFLFWPWLYLGVSLGAFAAAAMLRNFRYLKQIAYMVAIQLAYVLPLFFILPAADYRYSLPAVIITPIIIAAYIGGYSKLRS